MAPEDQAFLRNTEIHIPNTREVRESDFQYLTDNLRGADKAECLAATGIADPNISLRNSVECSDSSRVGLLDGRPEVIFGITTRYSAGLIWCLGTDKIVTQPRLFMVSSRATLKHWFEVHDQIDYMFNYVHDANEVHKRWLVFMGAELHDAAPVGARQELFRPFIIKREIYV